MSETSSNKEEIRISEITLTEHAGYQELSANLDGEHIWFRFPTDIKLTARPEIFIPFCLFEAMLHGCPIVIDPAFPVSENVVKNFEEIQNIYSNWNSDLTKIELIAHTEKIADTTDDVYCCYSGGIDSTYTYAKYRDQITHLLLIQGFDNFENEEGWQQSIRDRQAFADQENKKLITVANNARGFLERRRLPWSPVHGAILACSGVTLNAKTFYIPSSFTYDSLFPWGSHPLLDILWNTEVTKIVHDGLEATRSQKTEYLAQYQDLLDQLQVCWRSAGTNCGNCPKCVRTSVTLDVLGKSSAKIPDFKTHADINYLKPSSTGTLPFVEDLIYFTHRHGAHALEKKLKKFRRHFIIKNSSTDLIKAILGGWSRNLYRKLFPRTWEKYRTGYHARQSILDE
ncbi:hypothetical protein [Emcibacter sp.]|uniref:hypothetical protein n=1 Tax=Emcibacter sp. TaxID=1979954 RepID=UPI002AA7DC5C|nr:hypothetical protein [Emcibacter sp.]